MDTETGTDTDRQVNADLKYADKYSKNKRPSVCTVKDAKIWNFPIVEDGDVLRKKVKMRSMQSSTDFRK